MDLLAVFRDQPAEVEHVHGEALMLKNRLCRFDQAPGLRHLARTGVLGTRRAIDEQDAARLPAVVMPAVAIAMLTVGVNLLVDSLSARDLSMENW